MSRLPVTSDEIRTGKLTVDAHAATAMRAVQTRSLAIVNCKGRGRPCSAIIPARLEDTCGCSSMRDIVVHAQADGQP